MVSKLISTVGKYAAKKIGNKVLENTFDSYDNIKRKVINNSIGIKPLNVGERETIECLKNRRNSAEFCRSVGNAARKAYRKTGKY